jgi:type I restriction enzyme S subunit
MAVQVEQLITDHLDLWTQAQTAKSTSGRGSNNKIELTGIKKLRELILELAVRGKLVPQDPSDEPASELLKRITAEKEALVKAGNLKKQKPLPPITDEEKPFELPDSWELCRFQDVIDVRDGTHDSPKTAVGENVYPLVTSKDFLDGNIDFDSARTISEEDHLEISKRSLVEVDDILFSMIGGNIGNQVMVKDTRPFSIKNVALFKYFLKEATYPRYIFLVTQNLAYSLQHEASGGAQPFVSLGKLRSLVLLLPPVSEQRRIVEKVDELMALCDQLEQQSYQQLDAHNQLVDALLATLTQSQNADELASNWQRLAAHFDTLFTTEYSIDALKQTILQLAVMGKLVKQDPNDEPASELLKRIAAEKDALVKAGKIKKQKPLPPISEDEKPFELPRGWVWVHLLDISEEIGTGPFGSMIHKSDYISGGIPLINPSHMINDKIVEDKDISVNQAKLSELASYKLLSGDIVLARRGEVGRMAIVGERESGWLCGTGSFYLRLNKEISREFMALVFRVKSTREYLTGNAVGTTMVNLNHGILNSLPIGLPSPTVQNKIVHRVYELMMLCDALACKLNSVREIQAIFAAALVQQVMA